MESNQMNILSHTPETNTFNSKIRKYDQLILAKIKITAIKLLFNDDFQTRKKKIEN